MVRRPPTRTRNRLTEQIKITQIIGSLFHFIFLVCDKGDIKENNDIQSVLKKKFRNELRLLC